MAVCYYERQINRIKKKVLESSYQSYFHQYLKPPIIDEDCILLLSYFLQDCNLSEAERITYISAAIIALIALDVHENVTNPTVSHVKEKQLGVLAGDYYSGIYYNLLAGYNNIELIKALSKAVEIINEQKIYLYYSHAKDIHDFLHSVNQIETVLLSRFIYFFTESTLYSQFIEKFFFIKKLIKEMNNIQSNQESMFTYGLHRCLQLDPNYLQIIFQYAKEATEELIEQAKVLPSLPEIIESRVEQLAKEIKKLSSFLPEGV